MAVKKYNKNRRGYFREYNRRNKFRRKMQILMGGASKMISEEKDLSESVVYKTALIRKEQKRLDIKTNEVKRFLNLL